MLREANGFDESKPREKPHRPYEFPCCCRSSLLQSLLWPLLLPNNRDRLDSTRTYYCVSSGERCIAGKKDFDETKTSEEGKTRITRNVQSSGCCRYSLLQSLQLQSLLLPNDRDRLESNLLRFVWRTIYWREKDFDEIKTSKEGKTRITRNAPRSCCCRYSLLSSLSLLLLLLLLTNNGDRLESNLLLCFVCQTMYCREKDFDEIQKSRKQEKGGSPECTRIVPLSMLVAAFVVAIDP
jgi:hypothetical protein